MRSVSTKSKVSGIAGDPMDPKGPLMDPLHAHLAVDGGARLVQLIPIPWVARAEGRPIIYGAAPGRHAF